MNERDEGQPFVDAAVTMSRQMALASRIGITFLTPNSLASREHAMTQVRSAFSNGTTPTGNAQLGANVCSTNAKKLLSQDTSIRSASSAHHTFSKENKYRTSHRLVNAPFCDPRKGTLARPSISRHPTPARRCPGFTPNSRHRRASNPCPLSANSGHRAVSFDHLVGDGEQRRRNAYAECLCGLEVNHQIILCWGLRGQIGGLTEVVRCARMLRAVGAALPERPSVTALPRKRAPNRPPLCASNAAHGRRRANIFRHVTCRLATPFCRL